MIPWGWALALAVAPVVGLALELLLTRIRWTPYFRAGVPLHVDLVPIPRAPKGEGSAASVCWQASEDGLVRWWANPKTGEGEGYWDVDRYWSGAVSAAAVGGEGEFNLYTFAVEMYFCKKIDCGNPLGVWDLDAYKAEWISQRWKLVFSATRATAETSGRIGGYLMIFRPGAT